MSINQQICIMLDRMVTSVVDIPEGRIDELSEVPGLLCYVHQQWDGVVLTVVKVQEGFRETRLTRGGLC